MLAKKTVSDQDLKSQSRVLSTWLKRRNFGLFVLAPSSYLLVFGTLPRLICPVLSFFLQSRERRSLSRCQQSLLVFLLFLRFLVHPTPNSPSRRRLRRRRRRRRPRGLIGIERTKSLRAHRFFSSFSFPPQLLLFYRRSRHLHVLFFCNFPLKQISLSRLPSSRAPRQPQSFHFLSFWGKPQIADRKDSYKKTFFLVLSCVFFLEKQADDRERRLGGHSSLKLSKSPFFLCFFLLFLFLLLTQRS